MMKKILLTVVIAYTFCGMSFADNNWAVSMNLGIIDASSYLANIINQDTPSIAYNGPLTTYDTYTNTAPLLELKLYFPFDLPLANLSYYIKYRVFSYKFLYQNSYSNNGPIAIEYEQNNILCNYLGILGLEYKALNFSSWNIYISGDAGIMEPFGKSYTIFFYYGGPGNTTVNDYGTLGPKFDFSVNLGARENFNDNFYMDIDGGYSAEGPILKCGVGWNFIDNTKRTEVF